MIVGDQEPWPYDIKLSGRGYMLTRIANETGQMVPSFQIKGQQQLQARLDTGDIAGVFGSPEAEVPWVNGDFSGGMGLRDQMPGVINRYYYASGVDTRIPLKTMPGPLLTTHSLSGSAGTVRALAVMNVGGTTWTLFIGVGSNVFSSTDGVTFSLSKALGASRVVTSMVVYQGDQTLPFLFVGVEAGQKYWSYDGTTWTEHGSLEGVHFVALEDELWRSYKSSNDWFVAKSTDGGATATYGAGIQVGDRATAITEMIGYDDRAYVFKEDQVYTLQHSATAVAAEVWPGGLEMKDSLNGVGSAPWASHLYMVLPDAGLYEYTLTGTDQYIQPVGPDLLAANDSPVRGPVTAVCGERDYWLYAVVKNESGNSFLMAFDRNAWHGSLVDLGAITCSKMLVTDKITTNPKLFIGLGADVGSIVLARAGRDRSNDSNATFAATGSLYLPRFTGNFPFVDKSYVREAARAEGLDSTNTLQMAFQTAPGGGYSSLGGAWASVPQSPIHFSTGGVKADMLDTRLDFVSDGVYPPPIMSSWVLLYNLRPTFRRAFEFTVICGNDIPTNEVGNLDSQGFTDLEDALNNAADSGPVLLIAPNGLSYTVHVVVQAGSERIQSFQKGQPYRVSYDVTCYEQSALNVKGTHDRLEAYSHDQLEAYTHDQLEAL